MMTSAIGRRRMLLELRTGFVVVGAATFNCQRLLSMLAVDAADGGRRWNEGHVDSVSTAGHSAAISDRHLNNREQSSTLERWGSNGNRSVL